MIANDKQLDPQWLNDHGGARRRSKLEVLGAWMREQSPIWRYNAELDNRGAMDRIASAFLAASVSV